ncbi:MAG TPA: trypsin-like peptidase domain-containing protein [Gemmatimonadales bacterium]|nr:trypsin-like peptidase domain-containing protein [Gemmatimonadales bacterium]
MKAQIKFLAGGRAGQVETVSKAYLGIGRHPLSDIRFDAERDLDVSARHAALLVRGSDYVLQDLQSKNGTFVNGKRITADTILADGDVVGFGAEGPAFEFHVLERDTRAAPSPGEQAAGRASQAKAPMPAQRARSSTAVRVALEVAKQTRALRNTTKALFALLILVAAGFGAMQWKSGHDRDLQLAQMQAIEDSLRKEEQHFQSQIKDLNDAYQQAKTESDQLQQQLADARQNGDPETIARLHQQLDAAVARQQALNGAANVDYRAISHTNQDAVALVIVEYSDSSRFSGTAFAIDSQGTMVTNRHVLIGDDGNQHPNRIAVKFSGSKQWFQGHFIGVAADADLGVFRVDIKGGTPRILGVDRDPRDLERGDPVAILGFPLGLDLPMEGSGMTMVAEPTLTVGTASKVLSSLVQVDGYGAPGSSGSPIFNRNGQVVAVLYGGQAESGGKIIFSIPAATLLDFLGKQNLKAP